MPASGSDSTVHCARFPLAWKGAATASLENGSRSDDANTTIDRRRLPRHHISIGLHNRACEKGYRRPSLSRRASADRQSGKPHELPMGLRNQRSEICGPFSDLSGSEVPDRWHSLAETSPMPASGPENLATNAIISERAFTTSCKAY